ncbi:hypothetical protein GQR36_16475 [Enterococcus termitis]
MQNFDLIIYQQSMYSGLKESFLDNLALLNKPIVVLTFESEHVNEAKYAGNSDVTFVRYPISVTDLASKLAAIFEESANRKGQSSSERTIGIYAENEREAQHASFSHGAKLKNTTHFSLKIGH